MILKSLYLVASTWVLTLLRIIIFLFFLFFSISFSFSGTETVSHSNGKHGLSASELGIINLHLPITHCTSHDNEGKDKEAQDKTLSDVRGTIRNVV